MNGYEVVFAYTVVIDGGDVENEFHAVQLATEVVESTDPQAIKEALVASRSYPVPTDDEQGGAS